MNCSFAEETEARIRDMIRAVAVAVAVDRAEAITVSCTNLRGG